MTFKKGQHVVCIKNWDEIYPENTGGDVGQIFQVNKVWNMKEYQMLGLKEFPGSTIHEEHFKIPSKLEKVLK